MYAFDEYFKVFEEMTPLHSSALTLQPSHLALYLRPIHLR